MFLELCAFTSYLPHLPCIELLQYHNLVCTIDGVVANLVRYDMLSSILC